MIGLGRMGANMTRRLLRGGHEVVAFDVDQETVGALSDEGADGASSLEDLVDRLPAPRVVWVMVPAGAITAETIGHLERLLDADDVIIDGGNARWTDSKERAARLQERGIHFVDAGTSGGVWGLTEGYCLMVGAQRDVFARIEPILTTLAPERGYAHVGPPGAGHFTKMVHNGVEYGLMQAYGEGFDLLDSSEFDLDAAQIASLWRHGSVVRSWLLDLAATALQRDPTLESIQGYVEDSGEGRWCVEAAIDAAVPAPTIALALFARFDSRRENTFANRLIAALRREFGGHAVRPATERVEES